MTWPVGVLLFFLTIAAMEGVAYVAHRWVMHGFGWFLHESHHRARDGNWELNDLYAVIFAVPSIVLLAGGVQFDWGPARHGSARGSRPMARSISGFTTSSSIAACRRVICPRAGT